ARDVLENQLGLSVPLCGLVKDERHKTGELLFGDPPEVVPLERRSNEFYLVQRIQEEVHRFAITFHRQLRGKGVMQSELDKIPGVGVKRRNLLLTHSKSIQAIKDAAIEDITSLGIPKNVGENILNMVNDEKKTIGEK